LIYIDSMLLIVVTGTLRFGLGVNTSRRICDLAVLSCVSNGIEPCIKLTCLGLTFYLSTKLLMYF